MPFPALMLAETTPVPQDVALWAMGILCALIGALLLIILTRVLKQGDDTNTKVTAQGVTMARVEAAIANHEGRIESLHLWRNKLQEREFERAEAEVERLQEERRQQVRRTEDRSA